MPKTRCSRSRSSSHGVSVADLELDPAHHRPHRVHVQPGQRGLQIAHEELNEPRTVLPLQRELFVVDNDGVHLVIWLSGHLVIG